MLSTVVDRLTSLGSKHFVIGAFVPVLVFGFVNGLLLYLEFDWFTRWANPQIAGTARAFDAAVVFVGLAVVAYVMWGLSGYLREVLEGRHCATDWRATTWLRAKELERFRTRRTEYFAARDSAAELARDKESWKAALSTAAVAGLHTVDAAGTTVPNTVNTYDGKNGPAAAALASVRQVRVQAGDIAVAQLKQTVDALCIELRANNIRVAPPGARTSILADDHRDLLTLIDYAEDRWSSREAALVTDLQWRFGTRDVAPTAFGNVAAAIESYGMTRYGLNLGTFWSRLQAELQKNDKFFGMLQDAKSQLDFLVTSFWLAVATTITWACLLPFFGSSPARFVLTVVAGPIIARLCYVAAVENYIAFGEVVRTSVDLHRFTLLDALNVARPTSLRDERRLWGALQRVAGYGQEWVDIGYRRPPEAKT